MHHTFQVIRNFSYKLLLGIDFLIQQKAKVDFENCTLVIANQVTFLRKSNGQTREKIGVVKSAKRITLEPRSCTLVKLTSKFQTEGNCLVTPLENSQLLWNQPGLTSISFISKNHKNLYLPVYNETTRRFTIAQGQALGVIENCDENKVINSEIKPETNTINEISEESPKVQNINTRNISNKKGLDENLQKQFDDLLQKYDHLFAKSETDLGTTDLIQATFNTGDAQPIKQNPYRLPYSQWPILEKHLKELSEADIIEPSQSPWSSPILFVPRKDKSQPRMCVDFRKLNQILVKNSHPFELISIDTTGSFVESDTGERYVVSIIDHFSGWPECYAVKDKSAETVASLLLEKFIPTHTCPRAIISDNGTEYVNAIVELLLKRLKVAHIRTSVANPQGNSKCERSHRVFNDIIAKYAYLDHKSWPKYIPAVLMAMRTSVHDSTRFTPFFLVYGRDPVLPLDTLLTPKYKVYNNENYVPTMLERMHKVFKEVQQNTFDSRQNNRIRLNKRAKLQDFNVGDTVFYLDKSSKPNECAKFALKWKPFYRVIEKTGPVNYRIKDQLSGKERVVHAQYLSPAHPDQVWDVERDIPEHLEEQDEEPERVQPLRRAKLIANDQIYQPSTSKIGFDEKSDEEMLVDNEQGLPNHSYNLRSTTKRRRSLDPVSDSETRNSEVKKLRINWILGPNYKYYRTPMCYNSE